MWFLGYMASFTIAVFLVRYYAEPRVSWGIKAIVTLSWGLGFSYFLVLPFDIGNAFCSNCERAHGSGNASHSLCNCLPTAGIEFLEDLIPVVYTITMLLGYVMNDLLRGFLDSGEFTKRGRMKDTLIEAAKFYVPAAFIGLGFLIYMLAATGLTLQNLQGLGKGLMNAIGLFLLIAFMSYGLVEVPRHLWNLGNIDGLLRYYKFRVAVQSEALQNARRKLEETIELVQSTDTHLRHEPNADQLRENMAAILRRCPPSMWRSSTQALRPVNGGGTSGSSAVSEPGSAPQILKDEKLLPTTRKGLVALHLRLKRALANEKRQRSMYEHDVRQAIDFQAIFEVAGPQLPTSCTSTIGSVSAASIRRFGEPTPKPGSHSQVSRWRRTVKPLLSRVLSIACVALSLVIVWSEGTIMIDGRPFCINLSPLSYLFQWMGRGGGSVVVVGFLFVPILYCAMCTYFAMFRMKLCEGMTLHPDRHSDGSSMLFNATYACRLGPAICFNYLKLLHAPKGLYYHEGPGGCDEKAMNAARNVVQTYFSQTRFGNMDEVPPPFGGADQQGTGGDYFNNYAPLLIVVLCGCTYLNLGSGLLSCCAKCMPCVAAPAFSFDDDFSDTRIDHGAQILLHEKQALAEGTALGSNLQLLSGATSDSEETRSRGGRQPARRFNRFEDQL